MLVVCVTVPASLNFKPSLRVRSSLVKVKDVTIDPWVMRSKVLVTSSELSVVSDKEKAHEALCAKSPASSMATLIPTPMSLFGALEELCPTVSTSEIPSDVTSSIVEANCLPVYIDLADDIPPGVIITPDIMSVASVVPVNTTLSPTYICAETA